MKSQANRIAVIDEMRGIAILLMAAFHFCFDLSVFGFLTFKMDGGFYTWFRFVIVTLFFLAIGSGLYLAHSPSIRWKAFAIREAKIGLGALIITGSTFYLYPNSWVWFGVLHFIFIASILALPFIRYPKTAFILGVMIFVLYNTTDWFNLHYFWTTLREPLHLPRGTQDLTRLIPWLGMVMIGIYFGQQRYWGIQSLAPAPLKKTLHWLGKHSLIIYLVHQPPLFGIAWVLGQVFN